MNCWPLVQRFPELYSDIHAEEIKSVSIVHENQQTDAVSGKTKRFSREKYKMYMYENPDHARYRSTKGKEKRRIRGLFAPPPFLCAQLPQFRPSFGFRPPSHASLGAFGAHRCQRARPPHFLYECTRKAGARHFGAWHHDAWRNHRFRQSLTALLYCLHTYAQHASKRLTACLEVCKQQTKSIYILTFPGLF